MSRSAGTNLAESLVVLTVLGLLAVIALPGTLEVWGESRMTTAARHLATELHGLRWRAVTSGRAHGLYFELDAQGWKWFVVRDGNENGIRTAEVRNGIDVTLAGPRRLEWIVERVRLGFPGAGPFPRIPPSGGNLSSLADPIKFGPANIISFGPLGTASSGTLYITDGRRQLRGVLLFGPTARVRVWRYLERQGRWTL